MMLPALLIVFASLLIYSYYLLHRHYEKKIQEKDKLFKGMESQLIQTEKMASIGTLAAGIAHEINNPLSFLISNIEALCECVRSLSKDSSPEPQIRKTLLEDFLPMIQESYEGAVRIKKIVSDLRTFSRSSETQKVLLDINQVLESTLSIVWSEIKYKITIIKDYGAQSNIFADPTQLSQVFLNLLINASQAISQKGTITISTSEDEKNVSVKISDNGCGIHKEALPKIFDPFFSTKQGGAGLGLSVSYNIIKVHHKGEIQVESAPLCGTTFTVLLPKKEGEAKG
jgi:two-component system NtrC family sensor kinase